MRSLRGILGFGLAIAAVGIVAPDAAAATNLAVNPGFENPIQPASGCFSAPQSPGNWTAFAAQAMQIAATATSPVHGGALSAHVKTMPADRCGSAVFYQDLPQLAWNGSLELSAWMFPVDGRQGISVLFGWDHIVARAGSAGIGVSPESVRFAAWGGGISLPPVSFGAWHHFRLVADVPALTLHAFVDDQFAGSAPMNNPEVGTGATLSVGQGTGIGTPASEAFYDDVFVAKVAPLCPIQTALRGAPEQRATLRMLHRFRDEVMTGSPEGRRYIRLFYRHAWEGSRLLGQNPDLQVHTSTVLETVLPKLQAALAGQPAELSSADVRAIEGLMEDIASQASPALQRTIRQLRAQLRSGKFRALLRD